MIQMCSWCGKFIGIVGSTANDPAVISHGICAQCSERLLENYHHPDVKLAVPENRPRVRT